MTFFFSLRGSQLLVVNFLVLFVSQFLGLIVDNKGLYPSFLISFCRFFSFVSQFSMVAIGRLVVAWNGWCRLTTTVGAALVFVRLGKLPWCCQCCVFQVFWFYIVYLLFFFFGVCRCIFFCCAFIRLCFPCVFFICHLMTRQFSSDESKIFLKHYIASDPSLFSSLDMALKKWYLALSCVCLEDESC